MFHSDTLQQEPEHKTLEESPVHKSFSLVIAAQLCARDMHCSVLFANLARCWTFVIVSARTCMIHYETAARAAGHVALFERKSPLLSVSHVSTIGVSLASLLGSVSFHCRAEESNSKIAFLSTAFVVFQNRGPRPKHRKRRFIIREKSNKNSQKKKVG